MENISFSIVVATKGRVKLLIELIESINVARMNYSGDCEVLIVDDSSETESNQIRESCNKLDCKYLYYENAVSAKRNYGVQQARNEVILFLDFSSIVQPPPLLYYHVTLRL